VQQFLSLRFADANGATDCRDATRSVAEDMVMRVGEDEAFDSVRAAAPTRPQIPAVLRTARAR
jgi:hypothetical protein